MKIEYHQHLTIGVNWRKETWTTQDDRKKNGATRHAKWQHHWVQPGRKMLKTRLDVELLSLSYVSDGTARE